MQGNQKYYLQDDAYLKSKQKKVKTHWSHLHSVYFNKIQDDLKQTKLKTMDNSYISATDSQI